jgi:hypothetical protein
LKKKAAVTPTHKTPTPFAVMAMKMMTTLIPVLAPENHLNKVLAMNPKVKINPNCPKKAKTGLTLNVKLNKTTGKQPPGVMLSQIGKNLLRNAVEDEH